MWPCANRHSGSVWWLMVVGGSSTSNFCTLSTLHKVRVIIFHRATVTQRKSYVSMFMYKIFAKGSARVPDAAAISKSHLILVYLRRRQCWPRSRGCFRVRVLWLWLVHYNLQPPTLKVQAKWNYIFCTISKSISSAAYAPAPTSVLSLPLPTWLPQCLSDPGSTRGADTPHNE